MIKKNKGLFALLVVSFLVSIISVMLGIIPTSYDMTLPATTNNINKVYSFDNIETDKYDINTVSVITLYNVSILNYIQGSLNPFAHITKHNKYENTSNVYQQAAGSLQKEISLTNAAIAGFKEANIDINYSFLGNIVHSIFGLDQSPFMIGDIITSCEGFIVSENESFEEILIKQYGYKEINGKFYLNLEARDYYFDIIRNNEAKKIVVQPFLYESTDLTLYTLGIDFYSYYKINDVESKYNFKIGEGNSIGPSGGLMQSLFVYEALTGGFLTNNLKIAGTGTIDVYGRVGAIGGVESKVISAYSNGVDVFFIPKIHYEEAYAVYQNLITDMELVPVTSLRDVISYLSERKAKS